MSRAEKRQQEKRSYRFKLYTVVFILLLFLSAALIYVPALLFGTPLGGVSKEVSEETMNSPGATDTINIVLLGFDGSQTPDRDDALYRPDTIMIAALDLREGSARLVNIPRDSYVQIYGTDIYDKINHSYMHGYYRATEGEDSHQSGLKTTLLTVRSFLGGIPIHGYLSIGMDGAADIIDSVGGIYYEIESDIRADFGHGRVQLEEGYQLLDGRQFMYYVRTRASALGGERGRSGRQQQALIALFDQLRGPSGIIKTPGLIGAVMRNVETDISLPNLGLLGVIGLRINPAEIETFIFSGQGQLSARDGQNIWYLIINENERVEIIETVFRVKVEERAQISLPGPFVPEPETIDPETLPDPEPDLEPEPEPELEQEPDPGPDPELDHEPDLEPDPENESEEEPESEPEPEAEQGNESDYKPGDES